MADKKISELTELTTPDGTEELVVNDSGVSKKVQIDNLLAGGTISNFTSTGIDDNATSTAITIDASENVGIGVVPETDWNAAWVAFQVGSGAIANTVSGTQTALAHNAKFTTTSSFSGNKYIKTEQASSYVQANGTHAFRVAPSGTANTAITWTDAITIDNSGDVTLPAGNLVIGTSGKGIDFSATSDGSGTMTSEVLDDYEEGTWTPQFYHGTTAYTHSSGGSYTKIGRQVTLNGYATISAAGAAGVISLEGLPFAVGDTVPNTSLESSGTFGYVTLAGVATGPLTLTANTGSKCYVYQTTDGGCNTSSLDGTAFNGNESLRFSITYNV